MTVLTVLTVLTVVIVVTEVTLATIFFTKGIFLPHNCYSLKKLFHQKFFLPKLFHTTKKNFYTKKLFTTKLFHNFFSFLKNIFHLKTFFTKKNSPKENLIFFFFFYQQTFFPNRLFHQQNSNCGKNQVKFRQNSEIQILTI